MKKEQQITDLEKKLLSEKIINLFKEQGYSENDKLVDEFGKERNLENEIDEYIDAFGKELVEDIEEIDSKINEFFFNYEILKNVNEKNLNVSKKVLENAEEILKEIKSREKELNKLKDKFYNQIEEKNLTKEEKLQYKNVADIIIEKISNLLKYLKEQLELQINILKGKFVLKNMDSKKNEKTQLPKENNINININENDKIKIASMKNLSKEMLNYLCESENPRVLRKLALNESLGNEIFEKLSKCNDLKTKELLLENKTIHSTILENLIKDKDKYIRQRAMVNKNLSSEVLKELYKKNKKDNMIVKCIAKNENTPRDILDEISKNYKDETIKKIVLKNKSHPSKNIFVQPEESKEQNDILYRNLLINSDLRKNEILKMFNDNKIYADKNGNVIFPIKDIENKVVGAYQIDFGKNEKPVLLENSYVNQEDLEKTEKLINKIYESLEKEEIIEEMEIE